MSLSAGARLGPFEVLSPLGAGGMGEVYRARDTRLAREVAIKVLPSELASDAQRLKRFEKEALSASSLNHPNIVTIYEVGREGPTEYIAMELVDGTTLRALIGYEPMPTKKLLAISAQIADGLAKAHASGIVHRDLKPENVMVTGDGRVKILDFGLAKLARPDVESDAALTQTPTVSADTGAGVVMGTVGYMSPEQACGRSADFRSDQFSLGAIVYEMTTGRRAFQRETAPEALAAIIREEPEPIAALNPKAPVPLRWIVERCLAKDPRERYGSTDDLARDLAAVRDHLSEASLSSAVSAARPARVTGWLAAAVALFIAVGLASFVVGTRAAQRPPPTFQRLTFRNGYVSSARFAPDGQTIVYSASWGTEASDLFTTRAGSVEARPLGLPGAVLDSISSSGELLIHREKTLARMALAGGAPRDILEDVTGACWAPNGKDFAVARSGPRNRLEFPMGRVLYETLDVIDNPRVSPRGDRVAFLEHHLRGDNRGSVAVVDLEGRKRTLSAPFAAIDYLAWVPDGREIWFTASSGAAGSMYALDLAGRQRVVLNAPGNLELHDVAAGGRALVARWQSGHVMRGLAKGETRERDLGWLDLSMPFDIGADGQTLLFREDGEGTGALNGAAFLRKMDGSGAIRLGDGSPFSLSPDGKWALAVLLDPPPAQLVLLPTGAGEPRTLTHDGLEHQGGIWFPDGKRFLFAGREAGKGAFRIYTQDLDGGVPRAVSGEMQRLAGFSRDISPDGRFFAQPSQTEPGVFLFYPTDGGEPRPIPGWVKGEVPLRWSRDGRSLFVGHLREAPYEVSLLDLSTGHRTPWKTIVPPNDTQSIWVVLSPDGGSYAYSYSREASSLYLVDGLR